MNGTDGNGSERLAALDRRIEAAMQKRAAEKERLRQQKARVTERLYRTVGEACCKAAGDAEFPLAEFSVSDKSFLVLASTMITDTLKEGLHGKGAPVVAILDEIFHVGYLKVLTDAWGMAAGAAALQLWAVYQDVSQMMAQNKTSWQTMVQDSSASIYFGIRDQQTAEFVSKQCGVTDVLSRSRSVGIDRRSGMPVVNDSVGQTARPLLHPDEVRFGLAPDEMLLFADGLPGVCRATRKKYFEHPDFKKGKHYRDNPYFQKDGMAGRLLR